MARNKHPEETLNLIIDTALKLFIEKGYDQTSIQDIINHLGGLSKGAIYHHFSSKEKIFEAVCLKIEHDNASFYKKIRDDNRLNGYEKLKAMINSAYINPNNDAMIAMMNKILKDPKFLIRQIMEICDIIAPDYMLPIIEQGIQDGSIQTNHPRELAEVIITLMNIWINPIITRPTAEQMRSRIEFLVLLLKGIGIDVFDEDAIERYVSLCARYNLKNNCSS